MQSVFAVKNGKAREIANVLEDDSVVTVSAVPAYEDHPGCHGELMWDNQRGVYWEYVPYTPSEMREYLYETEKLISWDNSTITVDEANKLWQEYEAEGNTKASELTILIRNAKQSIREQHPDTN